MVGTCVWWWARLWQALNVRVSRKFIEALHILAPSMYIIEDVYRSNLVVYIRVYVRVIIKALMKFNTWYIAKKLVFAVFDLPRHPIWLGVARHFLASIWYRPSLLSRRPHRVILAASPLLLSSLRHLYCCPFYYLHCSILLILLFLKSKLVRPLEIGRASCRERV